MIIRAQLSVLSDPKGLSNDLVTALCVAGVNEITARQYVAETIGRHVAQYASQSELSDNSLATAENPELMTELIIQELRLKVATALQERVLVVVLP